jgi:hypothetical protein
VFVPESPPKSGLYFYNPEGSLFEPLFRAMMKDVLEIKPKNKDQGLSEFASRGFLLIDATYTPVNHPHLSQHDRNQLILDNFPLFLEDLGSHAAPETKVVLVKANVCELLEPKLTDSGFKVLNGGRKIPFPSTGQQNKFRTAVRHVLGLEPNQ